jgi:hypothetical protein
VIQKLLNLSSIFIASQKMRDIEKWDGSCSKQFSSIVELILATLAFLMSMLFRPRGMIKKKGNVSLLNLNLNMKLTVNCAAFSLLKL